MLLECSVPVSKTHLKNLINNNSNLFVRGVTVAEKDKKCKAFENFLKAQVHYVEEAKYFEGINKNYDPGEKYILDWVVSKASIFREKWDASKCRMCTSGGSHLSLTITSSLMRTTRDASVARVAVFHPAEMPRFAECSK